MNGQVEVLLDIMPFKFQASVLRQILHHAETWQVELSFKLSLSVSNSFMSLAYSIYC